MKKFVLVMVLVFSVFALAACSTDSTGDGKVSDDGAKDNQDEQLELTIEQLAMYDGKDGMDAYIAVNNVIYDVTDVAAWANGTHNGNMAGTDVTFVIVNAPHGDGVLDDLKVVGKIVD